MKIQDLTESFIEHAINKGDFTAYESCFPSLFNHYYQYWGGPRGKYPAHLNTETIRENAERIRSELHHIENSFQNAGLCLNEAKLVLFVGKKCSNGHVFKNQGRFFTWIPVETYPSRCAVSVFVTHELVHALHYEMTPSFFFDDLETKNHVGRQLITEGVATFLSAEILAIDDVTALWADYLPTEWAQQWMAKRNQNVATLSQWALDNFHASYEDNDFFNYYGLDDEDIFSSRSGYFLGNEVLKEVKRQYKLGTKALLELERNELEVLVKESLKSLAGS